MCHMSHVTCHMSGVTCQVSHVRCHMLVVMCQIFFSPGSGPDLLVANPHLGEPKTYSPQRLAAVKKEHLTLFLLLLWHFGCSVVTFVTPKKIQKYPKLSKNPKISKNHFPPSKVNFFWKICFLIKNKKNNLFLNIGNMQFDQSSPVQPNPEKKIWKNLKKKSNRRTDGRNPCVLYRISVNRKFTFVSCSVTQLTYLVPGNKCFVAMIIPTGSITRASSQYGRHLSPERQGNLHWRDPDIPHGRDAIGHFWWQFR